jgi:hypothetical protein
MNLAARGSLLAVLLCVGCGSTAAQPSDRASRLPELDALPAKPRGDAGVDARSTGPDAVVKAPTNADGGFACQEQVLCDRFSVSGFFDRTIPPTNIDVESARCVFRALRDRTPGRLTYVLDHAPNDSIIRSLHVLADGSVYEEQDYETEGQTDHRTLHFLPPAPDFFAECLTESDPIKVEVCLELANQAPVTTPIVCHPDPANDPRCPSACASQEPPGGKWECGDLPQPCPSVGFQTPASFNIGPPYKVTDPAAVACALQALRDGKPGRYSWGAGSNGGPGVDAGSDVIVRPGRVVLTTESWHRDLESGTYSHLSRLQDPAYFTACLQATGDAIYGCFAGAIRQSCRLTAR